MAVLQWVWSNIKDPPWQVRDRRERRYAFAVQLAAGRHPPWVKLVPPNDEPLQGIESRRCIVLARCDALIDHLARVADPGFPDRRKLEMVLELIVAQRAISMPLMEAVGSGRPALEVIFRSGRHRVLMLHELGATRIPVVVPANGVMDLLGLIG